MTVFTVGRRAVLGAPLLAVPGCAAACTMVASVPVRMVESYPVVTAEVAGQAVSLIVDTGAQGMLVTPGAAGALMLPLAGMRQVQGTGGSQEARIVRLPGLRLGGAAMPEQLAPVAPLPVDLRTEPPVAGLLGALLLSRFDVSLDLVRGQMALFVPGECPLPPGLAVPLEVSRYGEAFLPVRVNGTGLVALLDTGSRATLLTSGAARRLGLSAPVSANTAIGVDGTRQSLEHVTVRLAVGGGVERAAPVSIAPLELDEAELLLGADQLQGRALFVSYSRRVAVFGG